jgi:hypothetical protein
VGLVRLSLGDEESGGATIQAGRKRHPSLWMVAQQVLLMFLMPCPFPKTVLLHALLLSLLLWTAGSTANAQKPVPKKKKVAKQEQPAPPPLPAPPPPPPTLEQLPAVPPKVSFRNGMLTIVAENSTLSDILHAVRAQTGAAVEVPSNATERVVTHLGPGVPRDILAALLNGSHFNYVMLGSPTDANKVDRVILTSKAGGPSDAGSVPSPQRGAPPPVPEESEAVPDTPEQQPADDAAENSANDEQPQTPPNGQPQVKTPEQLLRELQQQQQQQQQQPGQGAPPGAPPQQK